MSIVADLIRRIETLHDGNKATVEILEPQPDNLGIPTLGWGAIFDAQGQRVTLQTPGVTRQEADALLDRDEGIAGASARKWCLPRVLPAHQHAAITDFIYNMGARRFQGSALRSAIRDGRDQDVFHTLKSWRLGNGKVIPGLEIRRLAEYDLWCGMALDEVFRRLVARQLISRRGRWIAPTTPGALAG